MTTAWFALLAFLQPVPAQPLDLYYGSFSITLQKPNQDRIEADGGYNTEWRQVRDWRSAEHGDTLQLIGCPGSWRLQQLEVCVTRRDGALWLWLDGDVDCTVVAAEWPRVRTDYRPQVVAPQGTRVGLYERTNGYAAAVNWTLTEEDGKRRPLVLGPVTIGKG